MKMLVPQKELVEPSKRIFPLRIIAYLTINSMIFFVLWVDLVTWLYQLIYFTLADIPKIRRAEYVIITRHKLPKLTPIQRWSCGYCEYVNGVIAWMKAVANQTEIYSCAIKYTHETPGQEYQEKFYEPAEFAEKK